MECLPCIPYGWHSPVLTPGRELCPWHQNIAQFPESSWWVVHGVPSRNRAANPTRKLAGVRGGHAISPLPLDTGPWAAAAKSAPSHSYLNTPVINKNLPPSPCPLPPPFPTPSFQMPRGLAAPLASAALLSQRAVSVWNPAVAQQSLWQRKINE